MLRSHPGHRRLPSIRKGGAPCATFLRCSALSALLLALPFSAQAAAPPANARMHVVLPDAATTLKGLSVPGRYTLVLLSPPFGQCDPCDALWAQLSGKSDLDIDVTKVQIDDEQGRPKILMEVRRLIDASMGLADGVDISYPMGVMLDPNGVVVQATFGKPRIDRKIREVSTALSANATAPPVPSTTAPTSASPSKELAAPTPRLSTAELVAAASGVGVVAGSLSLLGMLGVRLNQVNGIIQARCPADGPCSSTGMAAIATRNNLQGFSAAALMTAGMGALVVAEIAVLRLHDSAPHPGSVHVTASAAPGGVALSVVGSF